MARSLTVFALILFSSVVVTGNPVSEVTSEELRIINVELAENQFVGWDAGDIVFHSSFDEPQQWWEETGELTSAEHLGRKGKSLEQRYLPCGDRFGKRFVALGDYIVPKDDPQVVVRKGEVFEELYFSFHVKLSELNTGSILRVQGFATVDWRQAFMIKFLEREGHLVVEPYTGVNLAGDGLAVEKFNDFGSERLRELMLGIDHYGPGGSNVGKFDFSAPGNRNRWVQVEAYVQLNDYGERNGAIVTWVDGIEDIRLKGLNLRGSMSVGMNFVALDHWMPEDPKTEVRRYIDQFTLAKKRVGPMVANPEARLFRSSGEVESWVVQVGRKDEVGQFHTVWESERLRSQKDVYTHNQVGDFNLGRRALKLPPGTYWCRVTEVKDEGGLPYWSPWHFPFRVMGK